MIISRKRFEKEIRKKVKAAIRQHDLEKACRMQDKRIRKMQERLESLETTVDILFRRTNRMNENLARQKGGSVKGFFRGQDGNVTICSGSEQDNNESTMPEG